MLPLKYKLFASNVAHYALLAASLMIVVIPNNLVLASIAGLAAYILGWLYLPDLPHIKQAVTKAELESKIKQLTTQLAQAYEKEELDPLIQEKVDAFYQNCQNMLDELLTETSSKSVALQVGSQLIELLKQYVSLSSNLSKLSDYLSSNLKKDLTLKLSQVKKQLEGLNTTQRIYQVTAETKTNLEKQLQYFNLLEENHALVAAELKRLEESLNLFLLELKQTHATDGITVGIDNTLQNLASTNESLAEISKLTNSLPGLPRLSIKE
jgi:hypothetical protein